VEFFSRKIERKTFKVFIGQVGKLILFCLLHIVHPRLSQSFEVQVTKQILPSFSKDSDR